MSDKDFYVCKNHSTATGTYMNDEFISMKKIMNNEFVSWNKQKVIKITSNASTIVFIFLIL